MALAAEVTTLEDPPVFRAHRSNSEFDALWEVISRVLYQWCETRQITMSIELSRAPRVEYCDACFPDVGCVAGYERQPMVQRCRRQLGVYRRQREAA